MLHEGIRSISKTLVWVVQKDPKHNCYHDFRGDRNLKQYKAEMIQKNMYSFLLLSFRVFLPFYIQE